ncbi:uncharacterized protein [Clytia hemisphaerica]|uniref:EF-hand domain-containing protein n=1 Tax=Clytia hemisphaerica TaxID=252671 RepID=A0A7M5XL00_9CNID|eukprot:TCONS_00017733-protein
MAQVEDQAQFTDVQIAEFKEAFGLFDKNHDGSISVQELGEVMSRMGFDPTEGELEDMLHDISGSGDIDFEKFVNMMAKIKNVDEEEETKLAFKMFDKDQNGFIDKEELKLVMASLGEQLTDDEIQEMMAEADLDGDGTIDYNEFCQMMNSK